MQLNKRILEVQFHRFSELPITSNLHLCQDIEYSIFPGRDQGPFIG
jgi:hypothetical protein